MSVTVLKEYVLVAVMSFLFVCISTDRSEPVALSKRHDSKDSTISILVPK